MKLWKQFESRGLKPWLRRRQPWRRANCGAIRVHYQDHLDGGGRTFGPDYVPFLRERGLPRQQRVFEWCAGPGFIGFSLLAAELCDTLCLADVNPQAVRACRRTMAENGLADRVAIYRSDNLEGIPATERWDLVVGNPPHFDSVQKGELRFADEGWRLHREFFASVGKYLKPGGIILLQENNCGSTVETFRAMTEQAGLSIVHTHNDEPRRTAHAHIYYIGVMRRSDPPPPWLSAKPR